MTFDIDVNGILDVTATDTATGKAQSIRVTGSTWLPDADKQRMIHDAERYSAEDQARRAAAEKLNDADALCYQAERTLADHGDKLADDLRARIEAALRDTRVAVSDRDADRASQHAETLKTVLKEVGSTLYAQGAAVPAGTAAPGPTPGDEQAARERAGGGGYL